MTTPLTREERERLAKYRIQVRRSPTAARALIEHRLGVETLARSEGDCWAVYFDAPSGVDLDFLRPDVLPPSVRSKPSE